MVYGHVLRSGLGPYGASKSNGTYVERGAAGLLPSRSVYMQAQGGHGANHKCKRPVGFFNSSRRIWRFQLGLYEHLFTLWPWRIEAQIRRSQVPEQHSASESHRLFSRKHKVGASETTDTAVESAHHDSRVRVRVDTRDSDDGVVAGVACKAFRDFFLNVVVSASVKTKPRPEDSW
jgi:hypothetical protein